MNYFHFLSVRKNLIIKGAFLAAIVLVVSPTIGNTSLAASTVSVDIYALNQLNQTYTNFPVRVIAIDSTYSQIKTICLDAPTASYHNCFTCYNNQNCSYDFQLASIPSGSHYFTGTAYDVNNIILGQKSLTIIFNPITDVSACTDSCSYSGQKQCSGNGYQVCGQYDSDNCLEWSAVSSCLSGQTCSAGSCINATPNCVSQCAYAGQRICSGSGTYLVCGNYNSDSCLEWSSANFCLSSQTCSNGECITQTPTCSDECSYIAQRKCSGTNGYQVCGSYDADSCLDWSSVNYCSSNQTCNSGNCITPTPTCTNDCSYSGQKECSGTGYRTCGNYDSDSCLEWSTVVSCNSFAGWLSTYQCSGNILQRMWSDKGCSNGSCYSNDQWKTYQECGSDELTNNYQCSGNLLQRQKQKKGCSGTSCFTYPIWETVQDCAISGQVCQNNQCVNITPTCNNDCSYSGQKQCSGNGYQTCGNYDSDSCLEWSSAVSCLSSQTCSAGNCITPTPTCTNDCSYSGQKECSGTGYRTCGNYDSDSCLEWSTVVSCNSFAGWLSTYQCSGNILQRMWSDKGCSNGSCYSNDQWKTYQECGSDELTNNYQCSGNLLQRQKQKKGCSGTSCFTYPIWETVQDCAISGQVCQNNQCVNITPTCNNDCSYSGQKQCSGNGWRTCGQYDSDTCLEWSGISNCGSGTYCSNGECISSCVNQCYSGETRCTGSGYQTCGNYNSDSCLEWSSTYNCSGSTSCGYDQCNDNQRPYWQCSSNGTCDYTCNYDSSCTQSNDYLSCYDNDVWWFNYNGLRLTKATDCGDDYCNDSGSNYCSGNNVYRQRTCWHRGCSGASCYNSSYTDTQLVQTCGSNQTCSNGQCVYNNTCECSSGSCCDGCHYKSSSYTCNTQTEAQYGCPWGAGCGSDVGKQVKTRYQYCSGYSASCNGNFGNWINSTVWTVADTCTANEVCVGGKSTCEFAATCSTPIEQNTKECVGNSIFWFNPSGIQLSKYRDCNDSKTCTIDSCNNGKCLNKLVCDGTTCSKGTGDYCEQCSHCGDGVCNCEETPCSCQEDCKPINASAVSVLVKPSKESGNWREEITVEPNEPIDCLIIVSNNSENKIDELYVKTDLPSNMKINGGAVVTGANFTGSLTSGIKLTSLESGKIATISFNGYLAKDDFSNFTQEIVGTLTTNEISASDIAKLYPAGSGLAVASVGSFSNNWFFRLWYLWLLIFLVIAAYFLLRFLGFFEWRSQKRLDKIVKNRNNQ